MGYEELFACTYHNHELKYKYDETHWKCDGCLEPGSGGHYECPYPRCNFRLHTACLSPQDTIKGFRFYKSPERHSYCDACGRDIKGFVYHCDENGWDLHPCCAMLPESITSGNLELNLEKNMYFDCYKCGKIKLGGKRNTWCYVTTCGSYGLHFACVKEILLDNWDEAVYNVDVLVKRKTSSVKITSKKNKGGNFEKFQMYAKILKVVLSAAMAVSGGDLTGVITSFMNN